jgi:hypothetical protein
MTSQSPRIYTYKITFEEVPYYYYGSKKEKYFDEEYWGSPKTNKWCWELYTPKKQILQFFDYNDKGYEKCRKIEDRLIKPFYNTDKWCLNENCGGIVSLDIKREVGRMNYELKKGFFNYTKEERIQNSRNAGKIGGKKGGNRTKELGVGFFAMSEEEKYQARSKGAKTGIGGKKAKELGLGIHALTKEQRSENAKKINSQKWMCIETGFISTPGSLTKYQRNRNIDTSKRVRIE